MRLSVFALISQIPAYLFFKPFTEGKLYLNVFFTLVLGLLAIRLYDKIKDKYIKIIAVLIIALIAEILHMDYGAYGVLLIATFYVFRDQKAICILIASGLMIFHFLDRVPKFNAANIKLIKTNILASIFSISSLIPISLYNGKLGKSNKYLKIGFYLIYPVHLLIYYLFKVWFL